MLRVAFFGFLGVIMPSVVAPVYLHLLLVPVPE